MLFLIVLFLLSCLAYVALPIQHELIEGLKFQSFFKKDEKRLNKNELKTYNIYGKSKEPRNEKRLLRNFAFHVPNNRIIK